MSPLVSTYVAYLAVSAYITVVVGNTLHKHGRPFLVDVFAGRERMADAVNHLLLVGYYLVNLAFVTLTLRAGVHVITWEDALHLLSGKLGVVLATLGVMHFVNVAVLLCVRRRVWNTPAEVVEFLE